MRGSPAVHALSRSRGLVAGRVALAIGLFGCGQDTTAPGSTLTHPSGALQIPDTTGGAPFSLAISSSGYVLVTGVSVNSVARFALPSLQRTGNIAIDGNPFDVAFLPKDTLAFISAGRGSVQLVRMADNSTITSVPIPGFPLRLLADPAGGSIYVTSISGSAVLGELYRIHLATLSAGPPVTLGFAPDGMAFGPGHSHLYVSNSHSGTISDIDVATFTVSRTITVSGTPQDIVVSPDGTELYVADRRLGLMVRDLATGALLRTDTLPNGLLSLVMSPDGAQLYGTSPSAGAVVVIDRASRAVLKTIVTGGIPIRIAFSPSGDMALITNANGWVDIVK